ncbi:MAG TPA: DUF3460 family protein [Burkholderiales bacterium]|nr:DUF3460 family protein [Burkholderiales bacterium]
MYESDLTKFMRGYLEQHPEEVESQREGRAIWWDKAPAERTAPLAFPHSPRSGGAEYTFEPLSEGK